MKLYQFALPVTSSNMAAHRQFEQWALTLWGGTTKLPGTGLWRDLHRDYVESVIVYQIACEDTPSLEMVFGLFPDETAIFLAEIGSAEIHYRKD